MASRKAPVAVCVPVTRPDIFEQVVIPALLRAGASQIIAIDGPGNANEKRNRALEQVAQPYVAFCDDDVVVDVDFLRLSVETLKVTPTAVFTYPDSVEANHPLRGTRIYRSATWDAARLRRENYISMITVHRASVFETLRLDESVARFQDWDLWLTLADAGLQGKYLDNYLGFTTLFIGNTITVPDRVATREAENVVRRKHCLPIA